MNCNMKDNVINLDLQQILFERMTQEYEKFIDKLMASDPEDIIRASYEKVFKEDILAIVEAGDLEPAYLRALLRENNPLDGCYHKWLNEDVSYMEDLRACVESHAKSLMKHKDKEYER